MTQTSRNFLMAQNRDAMELIRVNESIAQKFMEQYSYRYLLSIRETLDCIATQYLGMANLNEYSSLNDPISASECAELSAQAKVFRKMGNLAEKRVQIADEVISIRATRETQGLTDVLGNPVEMTTTRGNAPRQH